MKNEITIANMPLGKLEVQKFVQESKELILNGEVDIKLYLVKLKMMEEAVKWLRDDKDIKEYGQAELIQNNGSIEAYGANLSLRESVRYDYSSDAGWVELNSEINQIKELQKSRETLLKALKDPVADPETGELIYPAIKSSTTSIVVSLKK